MYTASCFYADLVVGGEEHGHGTSRRLEKILGSIATLLGYRTWNRDSRKSRKISRNRNGKSIEAEGGTATDEAAYRIHFATNEAMLLYTIAVICWTTIRRILERKIYLSYYRKNLSRDRGTGKRWCFVTQNKMYEVGRTHREIFLLRRI